MGKKQPIIVVAGDVSTDWLQWTSEPERDTPDGVTNWKVHPQCRRRPVPGGTALLAELIRAWCPKARIHAPETGHTKSPADAIAIQSFMRLGQFPPQGKHGATYRVRELCGFGDPEDARPASTPPSRSDTKPDVVVLNDLGCGFRENKSAWPKAVKIKDQSPFIIYRPSRPLGKGALWELVSDRHGDHTTLMLNVELLREAGARISKNLSWERTATDACWQLAYNPKLSFLKKVRRLVVRMGLDGALLCTRDDEGFQCRLLYDAASMEGEFKDRVPGHMVGLGSVFCAAVTAHCADRGHEEIETAVKKGLLAARRSLLAGFGDGAKPPAYPIGAVTEPDRNEPAIAEIAVPRPVSRVKPDTSYWRILSDLTSSELKDVAFEIVRRGVGAALTNVPLGRFGHLQTVDRSEIESFRSIRNLMNEYAVSPPTRPLSLAVFGAPGSGKSFGVTQVAKSVAGDRIEKVEFNISQFQSADDLINALHRVHDIAIQGRLPLVFFDEFDSSLEGAELAWLKSFLAPMQDGEFVEGETTHPIGKAIFVFAGGTSVSFQHFSRADAGEADYARFRRANSLWQKYRDLNLGRKFNIFRLDRCFVEERTVWQWASSMTMVRATSGSPRARCRRRRAIRSINA